MRALVCQCRAPSVQIRGRHQRRQFEYLFKQLVVSDFIDEHWLASPFLKDLRNLDYFRKVQGFQTIIAAQREKIRVVNPNPGVVLNLRSSLSALHSSFPWFPELYTS
jgi:hypothetical protein